MPKQEGQKGRILDAGCGPGYDTLCSLKQGYDVAAMDPSETMAGIAEKQFAENKFGKTVVRLRFEDMLEEANCQKITSEGNFNGIWAEASLHHLPPEHLKEVLKTLCRALTKEGVLFFSWREGSKSWHQEDKDRLF